MHFSYYKRPLLVILILYIAFLTLRKDNLLKNSDDLGNFIPSEKARITAVTAEFPRKYDNRTIIFAKIRSVNGVQCKGRVVVYLNYAADFPWQSEIEITGSITKVKSAGIIGNTSWREYLFAKAIQTEIKAAEIKIIKPPGFIASAVNKIRRHTLNVFQKNFGVQASVILGGVTLGETTSLSPDLYRAFQNSGAVHLLVASGANVGFVTCIIYFLASWFGLNRKRSAFIALVAAGLYTLCAGADPPLVRAYIMTVFATVGFILQRESGIFQGLLVSCLIILFVTPVTLFHAGFQMSFLATLGILIAVANYKIKVRLPYPVKFILATFIVSAGAQFALYPVLALCFHKVPTVSLFANIVLVPLAGILMTAGFLVSILAFLPIGKFLFLAVYPTKFLLWLFIFLVEFFGGFSFSAFKVPSFNWTVTAAYYAVAFVLYHLTDKRVNKKLSFAITAFAVILTTVNFLFFKKGRIYLFSDAYRSKSVLVKTAKRNTFLIDAGIRGDILAKAVMAAGSLKLDAVFLTGLDYNSYGGLRELAANIKITDIFLPYGKLRPKLEKDLQFLKSKGIKITCVWQGDIIKTENRRVKVNWGIKRTAKKVSWRQAGYSGNAGYDNLSYEFILPQISFETGANGYFVDILKHSKITGGKFNIISPQGYTKEVSFTQNKLNVKKI
jgi:competence protein ComEC